MSAPREPKRATVGSPRRKGSPPGAAWKITLPLIEQAAELARQGNAQGVLGPGVGVSAVTFSKWLLEGELLPPDSQDLRRQLFDAVEQARAEAEIDQVANIVEHIDEDPKLSQWWLERNSLSGQWRKHDESTINVNMDVARQAQEKLREVFGIEGAAAPSRSPADEVSDDDAAAGESA